MGRPWEEADIVYAASVLEVALQDKMLLPKVMFDPLHGKPL